MCAEAAECPEAENEYTASDTPCGDDEGGCLEVTACGETIYCENNIEYPAVKFTYLFPVTFFFVLSGLLLGYLHYPGFWKWWVEAKGPLLEPFIELPLV